MLCFNLKLSVCRVDTSSFQCFCNSVQLLLSNRICRRSFTGSGTWQRKSCSHKALFSYLSWEVDKKRGYSCTIPNTHISSQYQQQVPQTNNDCHDLQIIQCSILYLCGSYKILLCCIFWEKTHLALWNLTAKMACWLDSSS